MPRKWDADGKWVVYDQHEWAQACGNGKRLCKTRKEAELVREELVSSSALAWRERPLGRNCLTYSFLDEVIKRAETMQPGPEPHPDHLDKWRFSMEVSQWVAEQYVKIEKINRNKSFCMSDSCGIRMTLLQADLPRFAPFVIAEPGEKWIVDDTGIPGLATIIAHQADYGWRSEREAAAKAGIPFHGTHENGIRYKSSAFVSLDGNLIGVWGDTCGSPIVTIDENLQPVGDMKDLREYFSKRKAVEKLFGEDVVGEDDPTCLFQLRDMKQRRQ